MVYVFYKAINQAVDDGRIVAPGGAFDTADPTCDKEYGNGVSAGDRTHRGSGEHDGIYLHDAEEKGVSRHSRLPSYLLTLIPAGDPHARE